MVVFFCVPTMSGTLYRASFNYVNNTGLTERRLKLASMRFATFPVRFSAFRPFDTLKLLHQEFIQVS
jgi:hypothetical protein